MRIRRAIGAAAVTALIVITGLIMSSDRTLDAPTPKPSPTVDQVAVFNEGFLESKEDDCDQGFKAACDWLALNA